MQAIIVSTEHDKAGEKFQLLKASERKDVVLLEQIFNKIDYSY